MPLNSSRIGNLGEVAHESGWQCQVKCKPRAGRTGIHGHQESCNHHQATSLWETQGRYSPTSIYTKTNQEGVEGRGGALTATQMPIWSSKLHGLPEQVFIIWCVAKTYMLNRGAWSANTTDQHWFNFNLSDDIYLLSQMHETFDLIF